MKPRDAEALLAGAVPAAAAAWADLGCGDGTFTLALARRLGAGSVIYAVDRDAAALETLVRRAAKEAARVIPVTADFTHGLELPGLAERPLDGMMLANALHFVDDAERVLGGLALRLRPGGRVVLIEYDGRRPGPWVPHPIDAKVWPALAAAAGLVDPAVTARRRSAFGGDLYVGIATMPGS